MSFRELTARWMSRWRPLLYKDNYKENDKDRVGAGKRRTPLIPAFSPSWTSTSSGTKNVTGKSLFLMGAMVSVCGLSLESTQR